MGCSSLTCTLTDTHTCRYMCNYTHTDTHEPEVSIEKLQRMSVGWPALQVPLEHERFHVSKVQSHPTPWCGHWPMAESWFLLICTTIFLMNRCLLPMKYKKTIRNWSLPSIIPLRMCVYYLQNTITYNQLLYNITISNYYCEKRTQGAWLVRPVVWGITLFFPPAYIITTKTLA